MAAKKQSPAELKKEGEALKALFAKIKKKPHNCAILMAKDGVVIEAHLKKSPEILVKMAKKAGGSAKGAWGTITMDGQVLMLDPINDKVPGNLAKLCKTFFAARGLKNRLEIKEPDELSQASGQTGAEGDGEVAPDGFDEAKAKKLKEQIKAFDTEAKNLPFAKPPSELDKLYTLLEQCEAGIIDQDLEKAEKILADAAKMLESLKKRSKAENDALLKAVPAGIKAYKDTIEYAKANPKDGNCKAFLKEIESIMQLVKMGLGISAQRRLESLKVRADWIKGASKARQDALITRYDMIKDFLDHIRAHESEEPWKKHADELAISELPKARKNEDWAMMHQLLPVVEKLAAKYPDYQKPGGGQALSDDAVSKKILMARYETLRSDAAGAQFRKDPPEKAAAFTLLEQCKKLIDNQAFTEAEEALSEAEKAIDALKKKAKAENDAVLKTIPSRLAAYKDTIEYAKANPKDGNCKAFLKEVADIGLLAKEGLAVAAEKRLKDLDIRAKWIKGASKERQDSLRARYEKVRAFVEHVLAHEKEEPWKGYLGKANFSGLSRNITREDWALVDQYLPAVEALAAKHPDIGKSGGGDNKGEELKARLDKLAPKIDTVVQTAEKLKLYENAPNNTAESLKGAKRMILSLIEKSDFKAAEGLLDTLPPTIASIEKDIAAFNAKQADGDRGDPSSNSGNTSDSGKRNVLDDLVVQGVSDEMKEKMKKWAEAEEKQKKTMARWLARHKQDINMVLKDKKSKHNKNLVKWVGAYGKYLKADNLVEAQQALDEVALVLRAYAKDFKLTEKQRKDIMKRVDDIKQKMLKEVDKLVKVNTDSNI